MLLRKIGDFNVKGSRGYYLEAVERPAGTRRYTAIGFEFLEDAHIRALARGETIDIPHDEHFMVERIDECF